MLALLSGVIENYGDLNGVFSPKNIRIALTEVPAPVSKVFDEAGVSNPQLFAAA